jgi:hypothetical protein
MSDEKPCPKCGEPLKGKPESRYCRNGCDIYTAAPTAGERYWDTHQRVTGADNTVTTAGGLNNRRAMPTCKE